MKNAYLFLIMSFVVLFGCSKDDAPSTPVVNFFSAINTGDSTKLINSVSSELKAQYLNSPTWGVRQTLDGYKDAHAEVTVKKVEQNDSTPNTAKVHIKVVYTGKEPYTSDSTYLNVIKEEDGWKISSLMPQSE